MQILISTMFGSRLAYPLARLVIPADPVAALTFARLLDRESDRNLAEGRPEQADRKAHLAYEARCYAAGAGR